MARFTFNLPDIGEGIAEAEIVAMHVKPGDRVEEDQQIADMMTDKATVELTSPVSGKVIAMHGEPGVMSAVGSPLVEFEVEGAGNASAAAEPARRGTSPTVAASAGREPSPRSVCSQSASSRPKRSSESARAAAWSAAPAVGTTGSSASLS